MDCLFSRITNIHPHPNADKLDLGLVNNWPVVVPKGSFIENEIGLFICPDAKLPNNKVWAEPFLNYTGKENRVRTVKLRGEYSNGIFVKLKDLASEYSIHDEDLILDIKPEQVAIDLGIGHYSPPLPNDLAVAFPNLPLNLTKTDEENWENIPEHQLLLGQKALVTRKMDGCSATYILTAGGEFYCCGRRFTYKNDCFNRYTKVGHEIVRPALEKWVKKYNETIIVRGEEGEFGVVEELLNKNPDGIMAMVIDSYNYERFIEVCGTKFKDLILNRNGRIVFRPDSGDIIKVSQRVLELLGQYFGYTVNNKGFKVLPDQVRALWGDGINISDMDRILEESAKNGWSSENWAFGMGGGLLQKINRDTCRFAFKCSAQKYDDKWHDVQKRPLDMSKASKKGRLSLILNEINKYQTIQETSERDILDLVFENGKLIREQTFSEIREIVRKNWV